MEKASVTDSKFNLCLERMIDRLCDEYESKLAEGEHPSLLAYLERVDDKHREQLGTELVRIQIELGTARGDHASVAGVLDQLPVELRKGIQALVQPALPQNTVHGLGSTVAVDATVDDQLPPALRDYEVKSQIAMGGMGVVWRMHDLHAGRDVAVKVMKAEAARIRGFQERFVEEAKFCAKLSHPFIVPIHAIGRLDDGRPYYVMKLVEGQTLAEMIKRSTRSVGDRTELLGIFHNVCEAMAFAHRKGVVHRDLKPHNIMVGRHGEVQLMDWGLAGSLGTDTTKPHQAAPDSVIRRPRRREADQTQFGDQLGTPSYMSPEQARGLTNQVDEASDVFSLGAILCELLTGKPPYVDTDSYPIEFQAVEADLEECFATLDTCGADRPLVDIARNCLSPKKRDRFASADGVAKALADYFVTSQQQLEQQRIQLERDRIAAVEMQRRRKLTFHFAAAASLLVCVSGALATWIWHVRKDAQHRSDAALERIHESIRAGDLSEALAQVKSAGGLDSHNTRFEKLAGDLELARRLDEVRNNYFTWQDGWFECFTALDAYEKAFRSHGLESGGVSRPDLNVDRLARQVRNSAVCSRIVDAIDDWAWLAHREAQRVVSDQERDNYLTLRNNLLSAADRADERATLNIRNPRLWDHPESLVSISAALMPDEYSPDVLVLISKLLPPEHQEQFLTRCHVVHPGDFWINVELGRLILEELAAAIPNGDHFPQDPASKLFGAPETISTSARARAMAAVGYYRAAIASGFDSGGVRLDLAAALAAAGDLEQARLECRHAIQILAGSPVSEKPLLSQSHYLLGLALRSAGDWPGAVTQFRAALSHDPTSAAIQWHLGVTLERAGRKNEAAAVLTRLLNSSDDDPATRSVVQE